MSKFPQVTGGFVPASVVPAWDTERAQNGPGIAVRKHRPGPDLSASLTVDEEH